MGKGKCMFQMWNNLYRGLQKNKGRWVMLEESLSSDDVLKAIELNKPFTIEDLYHKLKLEDTKRNRNKIYTKLYRLEKWFKLERGKYIRNVGFEYLILKRNLKC